MKTTTVTAETSTMSIDYPFPMTLLKAPGVLGELGALLPAIAGRCVYCRDGGEPAILDCQHCEGRGVNVYVRWGKDRDHFNRVFNETVAAAIDRAEDLGPEYAARAMLQKFEIESAESFRLAVGRELVGKIVQPNRVEVADEVTL